LKLKFLGGLILCNLIWSAHPVMFKAILLEFSAPETALLRYGTALIAFLLVWRLFHLSKPFALAFSPPSLRGVLLMGVLTFCVAPMLQLVGVDKSRATDSSLITALEPLAAIVLAWVFLGERLGWLNGLSFAIALAGFFLLSGLSVDSRATGNLLILGSCVLEGAYSVLGRKLLAKYGLIPLFGSTLLVGVLALLTSVIILAGNDWAGFGFGRRLIEASWSTWGAVLWVGPIGTCAAYFFWLTALNEVPVASVAVTLFIQPLLGALWGHWLMHDVLTSTQALGAVFIVLSLLLPVLITNLRDLRRKSKETSVALE